MARRQAAHGARRRGASASSVSASSGVVVEKPASCFSCCGCASCMARPVASVPLTLTRTVHKSWPLRARTGRARTTLAAERPVPQFIGGRRRTSAGRSKRPPKIVTAGANWADSVPSGGQMSCTGIARRCVPWRRGRGGLFLMEAPPTELCKMSASKRAAPTCISTPTKVP